MPENSLRYWQIQFSYLQLGKSYRSNWVAGIVSADMETAIEIAKANMPPNATEITLWSAHNRGPVDAIQYGAYHWAATRKKGRP